VTFSSPKLAPWNDREVPVPPTADLRIAPVHQEASSPVLSLEGVRRTFDADTAPVRALRGVDLHIAPGEFVALMGPSGSGKSTLLSVAAGLEPVDDGRVVLAGEDLTDMDEDGLARGRRRHVGMVFQFFNLLDGLSAQENVALAALVSGVGRREADQRARSLLDLLGLLPKASTAPAALSGGQRQRLAIARALANEPTVLLADEPTGALDSAGGAEVLELFRRLHAQGQTVLMVTHSLDVAAGADRVLTMRDGRIDPSEAAR
jgi:putative ABC transport system ATP-binding protein